MKELLKGVMVLVLFIVLVTKVNTWLENENYKRVAKYCDKENIVIAYTNDGDSYYTCNK